MRTHETERNRPMDDELRREEGNEELSRFSAAAYNLLLLLVVVFVVVCFSTIARRSFLYPLEVLPLCLLQ